jgi:mannose-6-phosphate isomerase-like protein (cupin superfamily)
VEEIESEEDPMQTDGTASARWDRIEDHGVAVDRMKEAAGYTINLVTINTAQDITPILASLAEGKCTCPHWGYMLSGRVTVRYDDGREEILDAGDPFYMRAGHTSWRADAGTELLQFSPSDLLAEVDAAISKAMASADQGA